MARRGSVRKKLLLLLGSTLAAALLTELFLREVVVLDGMLWQLDEKLLFRTWPGKRSLRWVDDTGAGWIYTRINSAGLRGPELGAKDRPRLAVYGDSFVQGEYCNESETFVVQLSNALRERASADVEVLNAGVTAYGPDQALLKFEREADALQPDAVLLCFCSLNDFGDPVRNKLFWIGEQGELVPNRFQIDASVHEGYEKRVDREHSSALLRTARFVWKSLTREEKGEPADFVAKQRKIRLAEYDEFVLQRDDRVTSLFSDNYDADMATEIDCPSSKFKQALARAILERFRDRCRERGIPLLVLVIPAEIDIEPSELEARSLAGHASYRPEALTETAVGIAGALEIPCLDLYPLFREHANQGLFNPGIDAHWSPRGQDVAADSAAGFLLEMPQLEPLLSR
jgi:hypothetical protein